MCAPTVTFTYYRDYYYSFFYHKPLRLKRAVLTRWSSWFEGHKFKAQLSCMNGINVDVHSSNALNVKTHLYKFIKIFPILWSKDAFLHKKKTKNRTKQKTSITSTK